MLHFYDIRIRRTIKNCESFHSNFNQSYYKESASINTLVAVSINEVQTEVYIKLRSTHLQNVAQEIVEFETDKIEINNL